MSNEQANNLPDQFAYMADVEEFFHPAFPRTVLITPRRWMEPYRDLEEGELSSRLQAARSHRDGFLIWMREIALFASSFNRAYNRPQGSGPDAEDARQSVTFRLDLLGLAAGNSKLALDAALAGYYSASMAIERHMLETWRRVAHARLNQEEIWRWYPESEWPTHAKNRPKKDYPRDHPKADHIAEVIESRGNVTDKRYRDIVRDGFSILSDHAHPTVEGATQTWTGTDGKRVFGPTYSDLHCRRCLTWGLTAGMMLLHEVAEVETPDESWDTEFNAINNALSPWLQAHQN